MAPRTRAATAAACLGAVRRVLPGRSHRGLARLRTNITLADLIHEAQPYQRQIIIMRNPVSRYYSAFHYYRRSSKAPFEGPDKFHEKVWSRMTWPLPELLLGCLRGSVERRRTPGQRWAGTLSMVAQAVAVPQACSVCVPR
jgi:hypothetical protein